MRSRLSIRHLGCSCLSHERLVVKLLAARAQDSGEDDLDLVAVTIEKAGEGETHNLQDWEFCWVSQAGRQSTGFGIEI